MSSIYVAYLTNPPSQYDIYANLESPIFIADAKNNIVFYTNNNLLFTQPY